jgi:hypothetical protein
MEHRYRYMQIDRLYMFWWALHHPMPPSTRHDAEASSGAYQIEYDACNELVRAGI